jgi:hypothetical protein
MAKKSYNGYIKEISEVNYVLSLQILVFKCQWVKDPKVLRWMNMGSVGVIYPGYHRLPVTAQNS